MANFKAMALTLLVALFTQQAVALTCDECRTNGVVVS